MDRAVRALAVAGEPLSAGQLIDRCGPAASVRVTVRRLDDDDRLVRTGRNRWALADWGGQPYRSLEAGLAATDPPRSRPRHVDRGVPAPPASLLRPPGRSSA